MTQTNETVKLSITVTDDVFIELKGSGVQLMAALILLMEREPRLLSVAEGALKVAKEKSYIGRSPTTNEA